MISGSDWMSQMKDNQNQGYFLASWTARVERIEQRFLWSSKSQEQKKEAPSQRELCLSNCMQYKVCVLWNETLFYCGS